MLARYLTVGGLFIAVAIMPTLFWDQPVPAAGTDADPEVPVEALRALQQGRYWRASVILRDYLATLPDTLPETALLAARAEAGWGAWRQVQALLGGRAWLDTVQNGYGWKLLGRSRLELGELGEAEAALGRYLELSPRADQHERGLISLRRGLALQGNGDVPGANAAYAEAASHVPQIGDWIELLAAQGEARAGDTAAVRTRLAALPTDLSDEWGWRLQVRALTNAGDPATALRVAESAANRLSAADRRATAWQRAGELRLMRGDTTGAIDAWRRAMEAAPGSMGALDAARVASGIGRVSPDDRLRAGRIFLRHGNLERGIAGLRAFLDSGSGSNLQRAEVGLELGRAWFRAGDYLTVERHLLALADASPSDRIGAEAMYTAARARYRRAGVAVARPLFLETAQRYPNESAAAQALFLVADLDHDEERLDTAREYYRRAIEARPDANEAGLAAMRLGGMHVLEGDLEGAASIFEEYRRAHPRGRRYQQATYWAGIVYDRLGRGGDAMARLQEVRRTDPFSYYGIRAAERLNVDFWDVPLEASPPPEPAVDAEVQRALARVDLLRDLGLAEMADFELNRVRSHFDRRDGGLYALAEALNERDMTFTGIRLGWEIHRREGVWNPRLMRIIYPFPYREVILAEAAERGVDPFLVAGLIRQESMFDAGIASPAGAIGLMQIMPATGRSLARQVGIDRFDVSLLRKPDLNVHLGIRYLDEMLGRYDRRLPPALAAYNAGPHRVARWSRFPEYPDDELFAERIPFAETRDYVKIVQQNARLYALLYADVIDAASPAAPGAPGSDPTP